MGLINFKKTLVSAILTAFFFCYSIYFAAVAEYIGCFVFIALGCIFLYQLYINGSKLAIDRTGITLSFLGKKRSSLLWSEIDEVGLIGEKVFTKDSKKTGDKYIYFSRSSMTEDERFSMILNWPPKKDVLYVEYSPEFLEKAQFYGKKDLKTYNVKDLFPNSDEENILDKNIKEIEE